MARATKGFMPEDEGAALWEVARSAAVSGIGPILEVGTYCAKSALYLGDAASASGCTVFTVDHHRGSEENQAGWEHHDPEVVGTDGRMDTLPYARRSVAQADLEGTVVLVVGASTVVAAGWQTPLGMLFIDGGHGDEVAWADYRAWAPKVAPGGWMAIHDVFEEPSQGGRPPWELYCDALASGDWDDDAPAACGSLRVLRRRRAG